MEKIICNYTGKQCYTQKAAGIVLRGAKNHKQRGSVIPRRSYFCKECGYYHLTSSFDKGSQQNHQPLKILNDTQEEFDLSEVL